MTRRSLIPCVLVTVVVAGCATAVSGTSAAAPPADAEPTRPASFGQPPRFAPSVNEPKDARGVAACDLLTDAQLLELDLIPDSATGSSPEAVPGCSWSSSTDATNPAGLQINSDTTIAALDIIHITRSTYGRFEPTEVAGHPAIRADDVADERCTLYTGIADHQAVATSYNLARRPLPDPCDIPRRMAEFILSNLPPLT